MTDRQPVAEIVVVSIYRPRPITDDAFVLTIASQDCLSSVLLILRAMKIEQGERVSVVLSWAPGETWTWRWPKNGG
jgi:hypothetical protein